MMVKALLVSSLRGITDNLRLRRCITGASSPRSVAETLDSRVSNDIF